MSTAEEDYQDSSGIVIKKREDDTISPRNILCSNQNFLDQLFDLFDTHDYPKHISQRVLNFP